jgi:hypothetical protein
MTMVGVAQSELLGDSRLMELLMDRLDGVVMLTEALNARSPLGEFTQFWRLFERAFHRGFREAAPLLVEFLRGGPHGFGEQEIDVWVEKRNPAVHADRRQTPTLDVDVQSVVGRMREAAYDVLLNKPGWADKATERREVWKPAAGSSDREGSVFGVQGRAWTLQGQLLDEFGSYPMLLAGPVEDVLPLAAWAMADHKDVYLRLRGVGALDLK